MHAVQELLEHMDIPTMVKVEDATDPRRQD